VRAILVSDELVPHAVHNRFLGIAPLASTRRDYLLRWLGEFEREQELREKPGDSSDGVDREIGGRSMSAADERKSRERMRA
jgi:hypothetical protein